MENNVLGGKKLVAFVVTTACLFAIASLGAKSISEQTAQNALLTSSAFSVSLDANRTRID